MGATATGHESGTPRRLVRRSIARTSTRTFCWMARRSRWRRLRRRVLSVSAPPSPKFHASRGRRALAARRISGSVTKRGGSVDWLTIFVLCARRGRAHVRVDRVAQGQAGDARPVPRGCGGRLDLLRPRRAGLSALRRAPGPGGPEPLLLLRGLSRRGGPRSAPGNAALSALAAGRRGVPRGGEPADSLHDDLPARVPVVGRQEGTDAEARDRQGHHHPRRPPPRRPRPPRPSRRRPPRRRQHRRDRRARPGGTGGRPRRGRPRGAAPSPAGQPPPPPPPPTPPRYGRPLGAPTTGHRPPLDRPPPGG